MSSSKMDQVLPNKITDKSVAAMVANALRFEHQNDTSIIKRIAQFTDTNSHAVKKWLSASNAPKSMHLLMLAACYPEVLKGLLELIGRADIWRASEAENPESKMQLKAYNSNDDSLFYTDKYVSINLVIDIDKAVNFNHRLLWFIGELQHGKKLKADDIALQWNVSDRTAWRDISVMLEQQIIRYNGAKKNGYYTMV